MTKIFTQLGLMMALLLVIPASSWAQPANDDCANAVQLIFNAGTIPGTTVDAVPPDDPVGCASDYGVWYYFVGDGNLNTIISPTTFDHELDIFTSDAGCGGSYTTLTCRDNSTGTETYSFTSTMSTTYYIYVAHYSTTSTSTGTFDIEVTSIAPIPNDDCAGALSYDATFGAVGAAGTCPTNTVVLDISNFTDAGDDPTCDFGGDAAAWYTWTANYTDLAFTSGTGAPGIEILSGSCGSFTSLGCLNNTSGQITGLTMGSSYYIIIWDDGTAGTTLDWCLEEYVPPMPPGNDECGGAIMLTVNADLNCGATTPGTVAAATASPQDATICSGTEDDDVWFTFVATATSHTIDLLNESGADLYHSLWEGTCGALTHQGLCSDPESSTATGLTIGATYHLRVYSWSATGGQTTTFDVCIGTLPPPPVNDACGGAISLTNGSMDSGTTILANDADAPPACDANNECPDNPSTVTTASFGVWYVYNSTSPETVTVNVTGFDSEVMVFEGSCGALSCVGGDDDSDAATSGSLFCWTSTANLTGGDPNRSAAAIDYYIYVDGHGTGTGSYTVSLVTAPLPVELISFEGTTLKSTNQLTWATATELGTESFVVERSHTGFDSWREIGRLSANGDSETRLDYQFEDKNPMANSYYRLKTIDFDRSEQNSEVVNLTRKTEGFAITSAFPNPTKDMINVQYHSVDNTEVTVRVNDIAGRLITTYKVAANDGFNDLEVQLGNVAPGTYFLSLSNEMSSVVQRIVKQ